MPLSHSPTQKGTTDTYGCLLHSGKDLQRPLLSSFHPLTHSCLQEGEQPIWSIGPCFLVGGRTVTMLYFHIFLEHLHLGAACSLDSHLLHPGKVNLPPLSHEKHLGQVQGLALVSLLGRGWNKPVHLTLILSRPNSHVDSYEHKIPKAQIQVRSLKLSQGPCMGFT